MSRLKNYMVESLQRYCCIYKANNGRYYMELASREYGEREDATTYGPFLSDEKALDYLDNFSNPGGWDQDDSGKAKVPTRSPNGGPVIKPSGAPSIMRRTRF